MESGKCEFISFDPGSGNLTVRIHENYSYIFKPIGNKYNGKDVRVTLAKWQNKRSEQASRLFHALRDKLSLYHGMDFEHMKRDLKYRYGVKEEVADGLWELKSTAEYTWSEMSFLIEMTLLECLENGIDARVESTEWQEVKEKSYGKEKNDTNSGAKTKGSKESK